LNIAALSFFGIVQRIFAFLSCSISRWEMLMNTFHTSLRGHYWCSEVSGSRGNKGLRCFTMLSLIHWETPEPISRTRSLPVQIDFLFLYTLASWNLVLRHIDWLDIEAESKIVTDRPAKCELYWRTHVRMWLKNLLLTLRKLNNWNFPELSHQWETRKEL
jgi:hypothetical protein